MFQPTALLVMTHNVTGLQYFCKTTRLHEIHTYKGSGVHWKRHMRKHGRNVSVGVLGVYYEEARCASAAEKFSVENGIVASDRWANLINENGYDGAPSGKNHPMYGKPSPCIGQKRPHVGKRGADNPMYGKPSAMCGKSNIGASEKLKGRNRPNGSGKKPRPVIRTDVNGIETRYDSIADAARDIGCYGTQISGCCNGKQKTVHGYKWRYAEEKL
jgi:hypothetical protein